MNRHGRDNYYVVGEGILTVDQDGHPIVQKASTQAELRKFRFSRLGPQGDAIDDNQRAIVAAVADAMVSNAAADPVSDPAVPAGFTYLGQFVDHDLTKDITADFLGQDVTVDQLVQGRSPSLDLDSLYGRGPDLDPKFYNPDGVTLLTGTTIGVGFPQNNHVANTDQDGYDLPRVGFGSTKAARRQANIPDPRNDENLAVAQTHAMMIRFHNTAIRKVAEKGVQGQLLFPTTRDEVTKHYQWMLRTDFLPRVVDPAIVDDVFTNGRKYFEVMKDYSADPYSYVAPGENYIQPGDTPTMPVEFSVAAYRLGHSMIRGGYQWNAVFNGNNGPGGVASLHLLFQFSGTSGILSPGPLDLEDPNAGAFERLPSNWIADFRRLYDFNEAGRPGLVLADEKENNKAMRLDTLLVNPLATLPLGTFGGRGAVPVAAGPALNLAFRNLVRAGMVRLASGQQMAEFFGLEVLKADVIIAGDGKGAVLDALTTDQKNHLGEHTPLWFYILREAELNGGRLTGVGGRIVAEVFHRAMEGSSASIVRDAGWRPSFGPDANTFRMVDLLLFAVDDDEKALFPLG